MCGINVIIQGYTVDALTSGADEGRGVAAISLG